MTEDKLLLLKKRVDDFDSFYQEMMSSLTSFVEKLGINPSYEVLVNSSKYVDYMDKALAHMEVESKEDRRFFIAHLGYFIGEYFSQKFDGYWFVNDNIESKFFSRYVIGKFSKFSQKNAMIDPFEASRMYVDSNIPRNLKEIINNIENELVKYT